MAKPVPPNQSLMVWAEKTWVVASEKVTVMVTVLTPFPDNPRIYTLSAAVGELKVNVPVPVPVVVPEAGIRKPLLPVKEAI